jgi:AcrR family transcriptional regulator
MTQAERRASTRARLIDAAADVFAREGFPGASIERVTDAAGLSRGSFYAHFESKDDLLLALVDRMVGDVQRFLTDLLDADPTPAAIIDALRGVRVGNSRGDRQWLLLYGELRQQALRDRKLRRRLTTHQRRLRELIAALIDRQSELLDFAPPAPSDQLALILIALDEGLTLLRATDDKIPNTAFLDALALLFESMTALALTRRTRR